MYEIDMFPSRFYMIGRAIEHRKLMNVLNTIKKDTKNLAAIVTGNSGPTYKTNYLFSEAHGTLFNPIIEEINRWLAKDNVSFELRGAPWYAEYGEHDHHPAHIHATSCPRDLNGQTDYNYSGIICLSDFGETAFINPNLSSLTEDFLRVNSEFNKVILFPSNIYHFVTPHGLRDKVRAIFSFNCILKPCGEEP